jgi:small-conductance mechanosensitive channel
MPIDTQTVEQYDFLKDLPGLQAVVFGNSVYSYLLTGASFFVIWFVLQLARRQAVKRLDRVVASQQTDKARGFWSFLQDLVGRIRPLTLAFLALYLATKRLAMSPSFERAYQIVVMIVIITQVATLLGQLVAYVITQQRGRQDDPIVKNTNRNLIALAKVGIWIGAVLFLLDNAGFNVSTFVAGLGIGGIAIALATQAMLGDAFSSFAIALDKPFEIGDFVIVGDFQGTVEHIGLKTTRIRSISGELLIFGNQDLTSSRIKNFKKMFQRRVVFSIGVTYDTPLKTLKAIPELIEKIIAEQKHARVDRVHFARCGASALEFEAVYFVDNPDFLDYMDIQQVINYRILEEFERLGVAMAFPTQTIHLAKS